MKTTLLTKKAAKELLGVGEIVLNRLLSEGALRAVRVGGRVFIPHAEIDRLVSGLPPSQSEERRLTGVPDAMAEFTSRVQEERLRGVHSSARDIAAALGASPGSVREVLRDIGMPFARGVPARPLGDLINKVRENAGIDWDEDLVLW